jgi:hypothetical protein
MTVRHFCCWHDSDVRDVGFRAAVRGIADIRLARSGRQVERMMT